MILRGSYCSLSPVRAFVVRRDKCQFYIYGYGHVPERIAALVVHTDGVNDDAIVPPKKNSLLESGCRRFVAEVCEGMNMYVPPPGCDHEHASSV